MRQGGIMKNSVLGSALIFFLFNTTSALAQVNNDPYLLIQKVSTKIISVEETQVATNEFYTWGDLPQIGPPMAPMAQGADPMAIADVFFKVWDIIKQGAPVVNVQYKNVNALPNLADNNWTALTGWKSERTVVFGVSTENLYGIKTVDLQYKVKLLYGGGVKGKGQYIASARVVPTKVDVIWGYNLDVTVEVPSILNLASNEDPLAAINLDVTYKISTILRSYSESNSYHLRGDGLFKADGVTQFQADARR